LEKIEVKSLVHSGVLIPVYKPVGFKIRFRGQEIALDKDQEEMAVAWVMANPVITAPIIGASRPEQLADTLAAAQTPLPPELKQRLDDLTLEYRRGDAAR